MGPLSRYTNDSLLLSFEVSQYTIKEDAGIVGLVLAYSWALWVLHCFDGFNQRCNWQLFMELQFCILCAILLTYSQLPRQHHYMSILMHCISDGLELQPHSVLVHMVSHEGNGVYRQMVEVILVSYLTNLCQAGIMPSKSLKIQPENRTVSISIYPLLQCQWLSVKNTWSKSVRPRLES